MTAKHIVTNGDGGLVLTEVKTPEVERALASVTGEPFGAPGKFTRRFTPKKQVRHMWLVLAGEAAKEYEVATSGPEFGETQARTILGLDSHTPILIGYLGRESS